VDHDGSIMTTKSFQSLLKITPFARLTEIDICVFSGLRPKVHGEHLKTFAMAPARRPAPRHPSPSHLTIFVTFNAALLRQRVNMNTAKIVIL
jgi:hypothetical protein